MTQTHYSSQPIGVQRQTTRHWKLNVDRAAASAWVRRKLPKARDIKMSLYHHPMMGCEFGWEIRRSKFSKITILVDLVSGRAFAAAPWDENSFEPPATQLLAENDHAQLSDQAALVTLEKARTAARSVAQVIVMRKQRFAVTGNLRASAPEIFFLKPNWWITGSHRGRPLELVLDGVTGKHYVFSA